MMHHMGIDLKVTCKKTEVLEQLKKNRDQHRTMVEEARTGYVASAREALSKKLDALATGKIVALSFGLVVPKDYTKIYDTTIRMLESHTGDTVELDADEYRHLMEDDWDWTDEFVGSNSRYSGSTRAYAATKGVEV